MKLTKTLRILALVLALTLVSVMMIACSQETPVADVPATDTPAADTPAADAPAGEATRTYYLCSSHQAHPYFADSHIGLRYAAECFNVNIVAVGPEGWDTKAQAESIEQAIAKQPAGIITRMWDESPAEAIKAARAADIPVIVTETRTDINPALTYIGLDNYQAGRDTAAELVKKAGDSGKVVLMGNWGASNTDAKLKGAKEYLAENTKWEVVAEVDDKAETAAAIEAAKSVFNNYTDINAIIGLDSSTGTGVATAMDELGKTPGSITVVVHDREATTLEFIKSGHITSTLINKTAACEYMGILLMEDWNVGGLKNIPISSDNAKAGVNPMPENMYMTAAIIDGSNVDMFFAENIPVTETKLYNY